MTTTIVTIVMLLLCLAFVKSTVIIPDYHCRDKQRPTKVDVFVWVLCLILAFIPVAKWFVMIMAPLITIFWFGTDGFKDDFSSKEIEISDKTIIGKIILFKI